MESHKLKADLELGAAARLTRQGQACSLLVFHWLVETPSRLEADSVPIG